MNFPTYRDELGVRGLGKSLAFPHNVKSQVYLQNAVIIKK
ncbi:hypothetical protein GXM_06897 [Nostoc sphaeroides CCNUC1]|uniref:Uncharacterized protein n=1 Tax=Nostoc sphaeroides CCNUC1 TaxID=2653204 RepID=A0A5P8W9D9_9NOSO|nr:hypothetical protein GXM_06897 [Nostoc sphaeroides CCNUC1]